MEDIYLTAVDPGWISEQLPPLARDAAKSSPPFDAVDAASRILDPIFSGIDDSHESKPWFGVLLKDFRAASW